MAKPYVVKTDDTCWGNPRIRGRRIMTHVIHNMFLAERNYKKVADWFGLTVPEVKAAVRYERKNKRK